MAWTFGDAEQVSEIAVIVRSPLSRKWLEENVGQGRIDATYPFTVGIGGGRGRF